MGVPENTLDFSLPSHNSEEALSRGKVISHGQAKMHGPVKGHGKLMGSPITPLPVRTGKVVPASPFLLPFSAGLDERSRESSTLLNVSHEGIAAETAGNGDRVP